MREEPKVYGELQEKLWEGPQEDESAVPDDMLQARATTLTQAAATTTLAQAAAALAQAAAASSLARAQLPRPE